MRGRSTAVPAERPWQRRLDAADHLDHHIDVLPRDERGGHILTGPVYVEGAVSIMYALDHRREFSGRWGWMPISARSSQASRMRAARSPIAPLWAASTPS